MKKFILILLAGGFLILSSQAQYAPSKILYEAEGREISDPREHSFADFDQDGDIDIAVPSYDDGKISWFENDGAGNFVQHVIAYHVMGSTQTVATDLNNDGLTDIISVSFSDNKIRWFENEGNGNFALEQFITDEIVRPSNVMANDVDGDNDQDILLTGNDESKVVWLENTNNGSNFIRHNIEATDWNSNSIRTADFDNDGDIDLVNYYTSLRQIEILENDGTGQFSLKDSITEPWDSYIYRLYTGDINNDGFEDLLYNVSGSKIKFKLNDGLGNFVDGGEFAIPLSSIYGFEVIDFNSDGNQDIIAGGYSNLIWMKNDGQLQFTIDTIYDAIINNLGMADLNGDGMLDVTGTSYNSIYWYESEEIVEGNVEAKIISHTSVENEILPNYKIGKVDSDAHIDFLLTSARPAVYNQSKLLPLYRNNQNQVVEGEPVLDINYFLEDFWKVNVDEDPSEELIFIINQFQIGMFDYNEAGYYDPIPQVTFFDSSFSIEIHDIKDLDNDGDLDLLTSFIDWPDRYLIKLLNDGNGDFSEAVSVIESPVEAEKVKSGDINMDGLEDIVVINKSQLMYYENDGNGGYLDPVLAELPKREGNLPSYVNIELADLNGNGDLEIFTTVLIYGDYLPGCHWFCGQTRYEVFIVYDLNPNTGNLFRRELYNEWLHDHSSVDYKLIYKDINEDGYIDILTYLEYSDLLVWITADDDANFEVLEVVNNELYTNYNSDIYINSEDIDLDGDEDVFVLHSNQDFSRLEMYESITNSPDADEDGHLVYLDCDDNNALIGDTLPELNVTDDIELCEGETLLLQVNDPISGLNYQWNGPEEFLAEGDQIEITEVEQLNDGFYEVIALTDICTTDPSEVMVNVLDLPNVEITEFESALTAESEFAQTYQWYLNGVAIDGANEASYVAEVTGLYHVEVTSLNGCVNISSTLNVIVTGLFTSAIGSDIVFYPNPISSKELLTINFGDYLSNAKTYTIRDIAGKIVDKGYLNSGVQQIDISNCNLGLHLIEFLIDETTYWGKLNVIR